MDLSHPAVDLLGRNATRVLQRLATVSDGLTGRRISELSGVPLGSTQRTLEHLHRVGLVTTRDAGRAIIHTLNRAHVLWMPIEAILASPARIEQLIGEVTQRVAGEQTAVALYGSFARGEAGRSSDIDILIVWGDDADDRTRAALLDRLNEDIGEATGNGVQIVDLTREDLKRLVLANDPLVESWRREARTLSGSPDVGSMIKALS